MAGRLKAEEDRGVVSHSTGVKFLVWPELFTTVILSAARAEFAQRGQVEDPYCLNSARDLTRCSHLSGLHKELNTF